MNLSRYTLKNIPAKVAEIPNDKTFDLPEKVLQFGTGVLLRGLPDYFINKANQKGIFNGRVVVVKSTSGSDPSTFEKQDCFYTICIRGVEGSEVRSENIINSSISRVLNASKEWDQVLECAHNPEMKIIISNTTEVGIQLMNDDIRKHPPVSFPGKLLAFLLERYHAFNGSTESGMVIVPTELIPDNGKALESIVLELAHLNGLEESFIEWLESSNRFCSSLVDRIVPGKPDSEALQNLEKELGYNDDLLIMAESYCLWAIVGNEKIKESLSFADADDSVVIQEDIDQFRELKLRLLNGTHTLSCPVAYLSGFDTVKEAMDNEILSGFISDLMHYELVVAIPHPVDRKIAADFGNKVLDRFRNPHIKHHWISISAQISSKMKLRCLPVLLKHYSENDSPPELFALGFAAYLFFMKPVRQVVNKFYGELNGKEYPVNDDRAEIFFNAWKDNSPEKVVDTILADNAFWGEDLSKLPGFKDSVLQKLNIIMNNGIHEAIKSVNSKKEFA